MPGLPVIKRKNNNYHKRAGGSGLFLTVVHLIKFRDDITQVSGNITSAEMTWSFPNKQHHEVGKQPLCWDERQPKSHFHYTDVKLDLEELDVG